jgi:hypothetical protein
MLFFNDLLLLKSDGRLVPQAEAPGSKGKTGAGSGRKESCIHCLDYGNIRSRGKTGLFRYLYFFFAEHPVVH